MLSKNDSTPVGIPSAEHDELRKALDSERAHLENLFNSLCEGIVLVDRRGIVKRVNREFKRLFGYEEEEVLGKCIDDLIAPAGELEKEAMDVTSTVVSGSERRLETVRRRADGTLIDVSVLASPITVEGEVTGFYGIYRDITERKRANENLARSKWRIEKLHGVSLNLQHCTSEKEVRSITISSASSILDFPACFISTVRKDRLVPVSLSEPDLEPSLDDFHPGDGLAGRAFMLQSTLTVPATDPEDNLCCHREGVRYIQLVASPIGAYGVFSGFGVTGDEIASEQVSLLELLLGHSSEAINRIRLNEELKDQALHDPLTGLYNRTYLDHLIRKEVERSSRYRHTVGLIMIDIDDFKEVNDSCGHKIGDEVLRTVALKLTEVLRSSDSIIRYGGDEFVVVLPENGEDTGQVVQRIRSRVSGCPEIEALVGRSVTISIGADTWRPGSDISIEDVLSKADMLMYEDKNKP